MKILKVIFLLAMSVGLLFLTWYYARQFKPLIQTATGQDYLNATYTIENQKISLTNGQAQTPINPNQPSMGMVKTRVFGNEAVGDLNGDGQPDVAFILTQTTSGTGVFYYAVAALKTDQGYVGTNAILLGDRIAPQPSQIQNEELIVSYATRKPTDSFAVRPSIGTSMYLKVISGQLVKVSK